MRNRIRNILIEAQDFNSRSNINKAFWEWFGDSKIVNKKGEPAICYHGTQAPEDFSEFAVGDFVENAGDYVRVGSGADPTTFLGSHFAYEPSVASKFASGLYGERHGRKDFGRIVPVYLKITNPYKTSDSEMRDEMLKGSYNSYSVDVALDNAEYLDLDLDDEEESENSEMEPYERYDQDEGFRMEINSSALGSEQEYDEEGSYELARDMAAYLQNKIVDAGHDGIIYKNEHEGGTSLIVFRPEQVKSIFNRGAWNPQSQDIME